jgi:murein DD-endopeptidase MepM/ murein hydrolase activator NlpD
MCKLIPRFILPSLLLSFAAACSGDSRDPGTGPQPRADSIAAIIPAGGGSLRMDGVGAVDFPAGALPAGTQATLQKTVTAEYAADFAATVGAVYEGAVQAPYQVVIDAVGAQPADDVSVTLAVPAAVRALAPPGSELRVFYTLFQISGDEREETVELLPGRFARTAEAATISLPPEAFAGEETGFRSHRAIVYVGYTLTGATAASTAWSPLYNHGTSECGPVPLTYPLDHRVTVERGFGQKRHPITGLMTGHAGIDFPVPTGTAVRAMADGRVSVVGYQYNANTKTGWGHFIVIQHGPAFSVYAHLTEAGRVPQGTVVKAGDLIAKSGASGGVTGPHLHVEYGPHGQYHQKDAKIDPSRCFGPTLFTQLSEFQAATQGTATITFDGIPNGVPSQTPGGHPGVAYYSRASYGPVTILAAHANSNKPGFTTISHWSVHPASYDFYMSGAHFGDALIPSLGGYGNDDGVIFDLGDSITAAGAHFGSIQEVSPCCVRQWVLVTFSDGGSLDVDLNDLRGGERSSDAFFGIASPGRPIRSIEFNQLGHNPLLDNFTYGQAR